MNISGCSQMGRSALFVSCLAAAGCSNYMPSTGEPDLGQGWTAGDRDYFYYTSQGSRLIRRDWLLALELERHDSQDLFLSDGLARFGYLPGSKSSRNPDGLPVGFAVDEAGETSWIGMNCAACHTSNVSYNGNTLRIDGAPASADMFALLEGLDKALQKTLGDETAFRRFAARVLGGADTAHGRTDLREELDEFYSDYFRKFVSDSRADVRWGPARVDAFGMIFNRVTSIDLGVPANSKKPNAPVSYPFLWGTSWHGWTQWNGAVPNATEIERLGRNVGQVLGVFGTADLTTMPTYASSVRLGNVRTLEQCVARLTAPAWPEELFGKLEPERVKAGRNLYVRNCAGCHEIVERDKQLAAAKVNLVLQKTIGTDPSMTTAAQRRAATGILAGRHQGLFGGERFGEEASAADILGHVVARVIAHGFLAGHRAEPEKAPKSKFFADEAGQPKYYKARPLNGIWATGPYLHNGSVRTLWQLLLPPEQREKRFYVGSREFDPREVGFVNKPGIVQFEMDTSVEGNWNSGHDRATQITDEQRRNLIEFLKSL